MHPSSPLYRPLATMMLLLTERFDRVTRRLDTDRWVEDRQPDTGFPVRG